MTFLLNVSTHWLNLWTSCLMENISSISWNHSQLISTLYIFWKRGKNIKVTIFFLLYLCLNTKHKIFIFTYYHILQVSLLYWSCGSAAAWHCRGCGGFWKDDTYFPFHCMVSWFRDVHQRLPYTVWAPIPPFSLEVYSFIAVFLHKSFHML